MSWSAEKSAEESIPVSWSAEESAEESIPVSWSAEESAEESIPVSWSAEESAEESIPESNVYIKHDSKFADQFLIYTAIPLLINKKCFHAAESGMSISTYGRLVWRLSCRLINRLNIASHISIRFSR